MMLTNNELLQFDQGIMRLSSFDPLSNQMQTRILCLPDLPALESLEHLFAPSPTSTPSAAKDGSLRLSKSLVSKSSASRHGKAPRRCYSNPSLSKMNGESHRPLRRSSSKRSLSNAFQALIRRAKRISRPSSSSWRTETILMDMDDERPSKKKRCNNQNTRVHVENWWSSSPPLLQASF